MAPEEHPLPVPPDVSYPPGMPLNPGPPPPGFDPTKDAPGPTLSPPPLPPLSLPEL